nr:acetyl-CoA carboxylase carboxyltransferase beta subunit [Lonicera tangutica]
MKKNNLHSDVFFRHQGGYSLKKLWLHLMLLDFERECGLSQSMDSAGTIENPCERDLYSAFAFIDPDKDDPDSGSDPYQDDPDSGSDPDKDDPDSGSDPDKDDPDYGSDPEEDYLQDDPDKDDPDSGSDPDKDDPDSGSDPDKDDPDSGSDPDKDDPDYGSDPEEDYLQDDPYQDDPDSGSDPYQDDPDSGSDPDQDDPDSGSDPDKDDPDYGSDPEEDYLQDDPDKDDPDSGSDPDKDDPDSGSDPYQDDPDSGSDPDKDDPDYGSDPEEDYLQDDPDKDDPDSGSDPDKDDPDSGSDPDKDDPDSGSDPYQDDPDYGSDPYGYFYESDPYGYFCESDPEDYLQKKRNPGGDYLQIDRYPEEACLKIERDPQKIDRYIEEPFLDYGSNPQKIDRYIEEPFLDYGSNPQKDDPSYGGDPDKDDPDYGSDPDKDDPDSGSDPYQDDPDYGSDPYQDDPDSGSDPDKDDPDSGSAPNPRKNYTHKYKHLWLMCDECYTLNYRRFLNERLYICEGCGFHLKMNSSERLKLLIDPDTWDPMNEKMASLDPIEFHSEEDPYIDRVNSYQKKTGLTEAIQTGLGKLNGIPIAMGVMEFGFMGGSMGSVVGEKITRLVEYAANQSLPLIIVCASGGARMQEGSLSLIQMAKISSCLYDFQTNQKLFYVSILTSPTTGGVTASFGMLGDVIVAEPDAYIAFAGKRVIELTLNKEVPEGSQETEYLFEKGLFDLVLPRKDLKSTLNKLFRSHGFFPLTLNQNHSSITEH